MLQLSVILKTILTVLKEYGMALTVLLIGKRKIESQLAQLGLMMINYLKTHLITQISLTVTLPM